MNEGRREYLSGLEVTLCAQPLAQSRNLARTKRALLGDVAQVIRTLRKRGTKMPPIVRVHGFVQQRVDF